MLLILTLASLALAEDYAQEAERMMKLSYDLDAVEEQLRAPPAAAPPSEPTPDRPRQAALPLEPNSRVDTVVVYADRARVTRVRPVDLGAGNRVVRFEGLPLGLSPDSLHAVVRAGNARIVSVELESEASEVAEDERTAPLREEAKKLTEDLGQVRDRMEALLARRAYLRGAVGGGKDRPAPSLEQLKATSAWLGEAERELATSLRKEQERAAELDERLTPLLIRLADPAATGRVVRVELEVGDRAAERGERSEKLEVALGYQVSGAGWTPAYNARLDPEKSTVTLDYYGVVSQATGETWANAELVLSTANPAVAGELPRLGAWYLGRYGGDVSAILAGGQGWDTTADGAVVRQAGAVAFPIPGRRTVQGDGSAQRLPVGSRSLPATLELITVPKLVPEVYRRARVKLTGDAPLLPGIVSSYVGGDYVGSGGMDAVVPGEELALSFGTDDGLTVKRTLVTRQRETYGPGRKMVRYTFHFRTEIANVGTAKRAVEVGDQVPVAEMDRVTVTPLESTPAAPPREEDPAGTLTWRLELAPGEKAVIDLRFQVTAPVEVAARMDAEYDAMF